MNDYQMRVPPLKPTLILGSGFHRHVFGDTENSVFRHLYDWHYLVSAVPARIQVAIPDKVVAPVQRWDTLVLRAAIPCSNWDDGWERLVLKAETYVR